MTSKNNQKKNGFSSLSIYRVADEEIGKLKNNRIHYTYQKAGKNNNTDNNKNKTNLHQSEQIIIKVPLFDNRTKEKNLRNKSVIKMNNPSYKSGEEIDQRSKSKNNYLRISNSSKDKDQNSANKKSTNTYTYKLKPGKKRNQNNRIDKIIIDLINNNDENATIKTDSNYYENENLYKNYINNKDKQENKDNNSELNNTNNNNINISNANNLQEALYLIQNRWIETCQEVKELNMPLLCDEIAKNKKEIELILNRRNNGKNIVKEISLSFIKKNHNINKIEINNNICIKDGWKNNMKRQNIKFFSIIQNVDKDKFLYSEKNYIKDLAKNIYIPKDNLRYFCAINNDNFLDNYNKIDYKILKPNTKNKLEEDLYNFYQEKKMNYLKNKDNNDELKLNPIYILNDKQIKQIYEDLNMPENKLNEFKKSQLSVAKQTAIDYEVIEIFTPKKNNKDNNSNYSKRSNINDELKNDKVSEINYAPEKKSSGEFGQYTPISMLSEKFGIYAVSRNIKYCIPERQGFFSFINNNNKIQIYNIDYLKRNKFSLKIEKCQNLESCKSSKNTTKRNEKSIDKRNILDYSKFSMESYDKGHNNK